MEPRAGQSAVIDLPPAVLVGGVFRFLSMRLADGGALDGLREEVRLWSGTYARSPERPSRSAPLAPSLPSSPADSEALRASVRAGAASRERILRATALCAAQSGFRGMTVSDIVALAGVSRRLFYNEFAGKSAAFTAAYESMFQRTIAACTPAFFSERGWPERIWQCGLAFSRFMSREPLLAYLGFVECYAVGPGFVPRVHDTQLAFTLFLEEGFRQSPQAQALPRACASLTQAAIFEAGFHACRSGVSIYMRRLQPLAAYIALTPFIGRDPAGEFVSATLAEARAGRTVAA
jgi:AcrR family transcriptional regulator